MDNSVVTIIGTRVVRKDGKEYMLVWYQQPFSDYDKETGECFGFKCGQEYTRKVFPQLKPGVKCKLYYSKGFGDKAVLDDVLVIDDKK